jgi:flavin-dependent dehydrogenase
MSRPNDFDVVIMGGGVAGLTAALQLKQRRPQTRVALVEKRSHPVSEAAAFKVGESIAEVAAFYLKDVLGLDSYLREHQLRKMGLRFFATANGNHDISRRVEYGLRQYSPLWNFHLDRGHIENFLVDHVADQGVEVIDSTPVNDVSFGDDRHTVHIGRNGARRELTAKWVVDATGRAALLRRKLGLTIDLEIDANACWFRVPYRLNIDEWSDDPDWRDGVPTGTRWKSTISLVGEGYWTWIINLASGATSVGVVTDPRYVPYERIRRYDVALDWLRGVEPQLAAHLPDSEAGLLDFHKRKQFSASCSRAFSHKRWSLTGEAAAFLDPLYSSGHDFTAIANTLGTDVIVNALEGAPDVGQRIRAHNRSFLGVAVLGQPMFQRQLESFRDPQVMGAKFLWDNSVYFTILLNVFRSGGMTDLEFVRGIHDDLKLTLKMVSYMEDRFREWASDEYDIVDAGLPLGTDFMAEGWFFTPLRNLSGQELNDHVKDSLSRLEKTSRQMVSRFSEAAGRPEPPRTYPSPPPSAEDIIDWAPYDPLAGGPVIADGQSSWHAQRRLHAAGAA